MYNILLLLVRRTIMLHSGEARVRNRRSQCEKRLLDIIRNTYKRMNKALSSVHPDYTLALTHAHRTCTYSLLLSLHNCGIGIEFLVQCMHSTTQQLVYVSLTLNNMLCNAHSDYALRNRINFLLRNVI